MRQLRVAAFAAVLGAIATLAMPTEYVWEMMFPPPFAGVPQIMMSLACVSPDLCYVPGGSNGQGFAVYSYDGKANGNMMAMNEPNMTLMILTATAGGTTAAPHAAFGGVGMLTVSDALQYLNNGTWLPSSIPYEFVWETQSMAATDDGQHIISLGSGVSGTQIMHSTNAGASFTPITVAIPPLQADCTSPMYASMVSDQVWYVSMGGFPQNNKGGSGSGSSSGSSSGSGSNMHRIKSNLRHTSPFSALHTAEDGKVSHHFVSAKTRAALHKAGAHAQSQCGYTAQIAKTTDAGKTWTVQLSSWNYTMGQIDCISATHCVAVGSGVDANNNTLTVVLRTTDGNTWTEVMSLTNSPLTFQAVEFADAQEVWISGGWADQSTQATAGVFYVSQDGGASWQLSGEMVPDVGMVMDMSFPANSGVGFAVGITQSQASTIMRYKKQSFAGYFTQSNCPFAGCSFLCQNMTFPQGMCMEVQGGSVVATCNGDAIEQKVYQTTSCIGSFQTVPMPINQCLNNSGSFFVNYCNTTVGAKETKPVRSTGFFGLF